MNPQRGEKRKKKVKKVKRIHKSTIVLKETLEDFIYINSQIFEEGQVLENVDSYWKKKINEALEVSSSSSASRSRSPSRDLEDRQVSTKEHKERRRSRSESRDLDDRPVSTKEHKERRRSREREKERKGRSTSRDGEEKKKKSSKDHKRKHSSSSERKGDQKEDKRSRRDERNQSSSNEQDNADDDDYRRRSERKKSKNSEPEEPKKEVKPATEVFKPPTMGAYIPPAKLRMMQNAIEDKSSASYQRIAWEALKKSINGLINKVDSSNISVIVRELFKENLIRGRGLLCQIIMQSQAASSIYTDVFAALVSIINTKFPNIGELLLKRLILQFRRGYKRNDKTSCLAAVKFIAHLVNQQVAHEVLGLEILTLLLEHPTAYSVEVAIAFLKEIGARLDDVSPRGSHAIFERLRRVLNEGDLEKRVQDMIEVMFQIRKDKYKQFPSVAEELNEVEEKDQFTHLVTLNGNFEGEEMLNVFKFDEEYLATEEKYALLRKEILDEDEEDDEKISSFVSKDFDLPDNEDAAQQFFFLWEPESPEDKAEYYKYRRIVQRMEVTNNQLVQSSKCIVPGCKCPTKYKYKFNFYAHLDRHYKVGYFCPRPGCNSTFPSYPTFQRHLDVHRGQSYDCQECGEIFKWEANLVSHIKHMHDHFTGLSEDVSVLYFKRSLGKIHVRKFKQRDIKHIKQICMAFWSKPGYKIKNQVSYTKAKNVYRCFKRREVASNTKLKKFILSSYTGGCGSMGNLFRKGWKFYPKTGRTVLHYVSGERGIDTTTKFCVRIKAGSNAVFKPKLSVLQFTQQAILFIEEQVKKALSDKKQAVETAQESQETEEAEDEEQEQESEDESEESEEEISSGEEEE